MRALLLGDSIRMGYQLFVRDELADLADVVGPEDNCEDSGNVLANLDRWLGAGTWRVIHFNCGLHDIKCDRGTRVCKTPGDQVALEVIREHGIQINDLHAVVMAGGVERLLSEDGVHFIEAGSRLLAGAVSGAIRTGIGTVRRM